MIKRIVRMSFRESEIESFLSIFSQNKQHIRSFPGCLHLELWTDKYNQSIFFTYSIWDSEEALQQYRKSDLFKKTWFKTKKLFAEKPNAWTVTNLDTLT